MFACCLTLITNQVHKTVKPKHKQTLTTGERWWWWYTSNKNRKR